MTTFDLLVREPGQTERYVTVDGTLDAGREVEGLLLADAQTSRRHLRFTVDGDVLSVTDLGSTNGTTVNGSRIERPTPVADGDTIEVGDTVIVVASHRQAVAPEVGAPEPAPGSTAAYSVEDSAPPPAPPPVPAGATLSFTVCAAGRSHGQGADPSASRVNRLIDAPIASLTVFQGSVLPAFCDKAVAIARALVSSPVQAVGRFAGRISITLIAAGGTHNAAIGANMPAGIGSARRLAGPESSHTLPAWTASPIAALTTSTDALGTGTGS